jgi:hypothetical protein
MSDFPTNGPTWQLAWTASATAHRRVAGYRLPAALDRRILELGERKETLTADERAELLAWVSFTQERSVEKLEAELALRRLAEASPELVARP